MTENVKAGVIGVGYLERFHAQKYAKMAEIELISIADADPQRTAQVLAAVHDGAHEPQPGALLVTVREHLHAWQRAGTLGRNGWWFTLWECAVCGQQVIDIGQRNAEVLP